MAVSLSDLSVLSANVLLRCTFFTLFAMPVRWRDVAEARAPNGSIPHDAHVSDLPSRAQALYDVALFGLAPSSICGQAPHAIQGDWVGILCAYVHT